MNKSSPCEIEFSNPHTAANSISSQDQMQDLMGREKERGSERRFGLIGNIDKAMHGGEKQRNQRSAR